MHYLRGWGPRHDAPGEVERPARRRARLLCVPLAAALLLPAGAHAALSTSVVSASVDGPNAAMTDNYAAASCGAGRLVSGGGARVDQTVLSNGTHLVGSVPTPDGIGQSANGDANPTVWLGGGGIGGQATSGVTTWGYAICLDAGPTATAVVAASKPGPSETFTGVLSTVTCPPGTRLLSGGARTTPGTVGSLKPNGSFPSSDAGVPVIGGTNPTSWTAAGLNGGQPPKDNTTHGFAICATAGADITVTISNARIDGPGLPSTGDQVTTTCPPGAVLLGGGGYISDHFALPGSQGDHLTGTFPSDAQGHPITSGSASSWTAASHIGGSPTGPLTDTNVWAMCASEGAPGGGAGGNAGGGGPIVAGTPGAIAGGVTLSQIREAMRRQMVPAAGAARLQMIVRKRGAALPFKALDSGRLTISWYTVARTVRAGHRTRKTKPVLVARGQRTFKRSGEQTVNVRLTPAGLRTLRRARRVALTAKGSFLRTGSRVPILGTKAFVLTRNAASTAP